MLRSTQNSCTPVVKPSSSCHHFIGCRNIRPSPECGPPYHKQKKKKQFMIECAQPRISLPSGLVGDLPDVCTAGKGFVAAFAGIVFCKACLHDLQAKIPLILVQEEQTTPKVAKPPGFRFMIASRCLKKPSGELMSSRPHCLQRTLVYGTCMEGRI